jgi:EAL domain-containing protein (putative c-di-GMP-specific phosphodiesterase class I)/AmiR/NasT family two-component response regulator
MPADRHFTAGLRRRVLVIDDDEAFCRLLARLVADLGYQVKTSCRLHPGDLADLDAVDVIFVDMMMPGLDGIQALDVLSRHQVKSSIVLMSGAHGEVLATAQTIAKRSGLSVTAILNKPFRGADVRRILEKEHHESEQPSRLPLASEINMEDLLTGLERHEFDAYLQPIAELATSQTVGYEALARWRSDKFNLVMPTRFIAVAARNGILPRLSRQIISRALAHAAELKRRGKPWKVSVNLGVEDLLDNELPEKLAEMVSGHDLPPGSLSVELTESSATANEIMMLGTLARLRLKGIDLAIDDFGTSYSGLDRLSTIPFTSLKIDMRFITDMMTNKNARMIVESSIALAKRLKMKTVAEGIETEAQLALLKDMRCDFGQGYLFAPPMEFQKLLIWNQLGSHS